VSRRYVPKRGDVVWLHFNPQTGHEQAGRRQAVVLSPESYNEKTGLALFCPVTSQVKGYPFETAFSSALPVKGVALCDQIKSLDWASRKPEFICKMPPEVMDEIMGKALAQGGYRKKVFLMTKNCERDAKGTRRTFARDGDVPKVEVRDPLQGHIDNLLNITDQHMRDVTAYLVTLK